MHENFPSKDFFKINGVSSETVGIYVDTPPVPPMAHKKHTNYFYDVDDDYVYEDIKFTIRFFTFYNEDFDNSAIYAFLHNAETLEISRLSGYYYKIKDFEVQQPNVSYDGAKIEYQVDFTLEPFKYKIENPEIEITNGQTITNTGERYCKPVYKITGTADFSLWVNEKHVLDILNFNGTAIVDTDTMTVIDAETGRNLLPQTTGDFSGWLHTGNNVVGWEGNATNMTLTLNERSY